MQKVAQASYQPKAKKWGKQAIMGTFPDGTVKEVISFYADEISITCEEVIGLNQDEIYDLFRTKDIAYIQGG